MNTFGFGIQPFSLTGGGGGGLAGAESGTGVVGSKVRLGINPLLQDTFIEASGFLFQVDGINSVALSNGFNVVQGPSSYWGAIDASGNIKRIISQADSGEGFLVDDQSDDAGITTNKAYGNDPNVGPTFTVVPFTLTNNRRYLTQDFVPWIHQIQQLRNITSTGGVSINYTFISSLFNVLVRLNMAVFVNTLAAGGNINIQIQYTDEGSDLKMLNLTPIAALNAAPPIMPMVLYVQRGSGVSIVVTNNLNGNSVNVYSMLEILNVMN